MTPSPLVAFQLLDAYVALWCDPNPVVTGRCIRGGAKVEVIGNLIADPIDEDVAANVGEIRRINAAGTAGRLYDVRPATARQPDHPYIVAFPGNG